MRNRWYSSSILALAAIAVLAWSSTPAAAQRGRGARGREGGGGGNWSANQGNWNGGGWYGGRGYSNGWYGGRGWYGDGYGWYGEGYGYNRWNRPYYWGNDAYYDNGYLSYDGDNTGGYTSFYSGDAQNEDPNAVRFSVRVPADAQVLFDGDRTQQRGELRRFVSPPLDPNRTYAYEIKASWNENGRPIEQARTVRVHGGQTVNVDFLTMNNRGDDHMGQGDDTYNRNRIDLDRNRNDLDRNRNDLDRNRTGVDRNLDRNRTDMDRDRNNRVPDQQNEMRRDNTGNRDNRTVPSNPDDKDRNKPPV